MAKILNNAQAIAVSDALCALNNVGGNLRAVFDGIVVQERAGGAICVTKTSGPSEDYKSQNAFLIAYGLVA